MAPDSKTDIGALPSFGARSTIAGMRLFGEISRNSGCELLARADVHGHDLVRHPRLFQKHRDLVAVGRRPIVEIDHREPFASWPRRKAGSRSVTVYGALSHGRLFARPGFRMRGDHAAAAGFPVTHVSYMSMLAGSNAAMSAR